VGFLGGGWFGGGGGGWWGGGVGGGGLGFLRDCGVEGGWVGGGGVCGDPLLPPEEGAERFRLDLRRLLEKTPKHQPKKEKKQPTQEKKEKKKKKKKNRLHPLLAGGWSSKRGRLVPSKGNILQLGYVYHEAGHSS